MYKARVTSTNTSNKFFLRIGQQLEWMPNGFVMKDDIKYSLTLLIVTAITQTCSYSNGGIL